MSSTDTTHRGSAPRARLHRLPPGPGARPRPVGDLLREGPGLVGRPRERRLRGPGDDRSAHHRGGAGRRGWPGAVDLRRRAVARPQRGDEHRRNGADAAGPRRRRALAGRRSPTRRGTGSVSSPRSARHSHRRCSRCRTSRPRAAGTRSCWAWSATTAAPSTSGSPPGAGSSSSCTRPASSTTTVRSARRRTGRGRCPRLVRGGRRLRRRGHAGGAARRSRRTGAAPQPARGQRPLAPRAVDLRPRRLHGRGGQP